ncbi:hypothetical protein BDR06DRAFT_948040 [Suillus hirtellus]|nr:hypothetical protein BDR06DRAFT_948040 [Suillus hirtellus]
MDEKKSENREAEGESLSPRKTSFNMSLGGYLTSLEISVALLTALCRIGRRPIIETEVACVAMMCLVWLATYLVVEALPNHGKFCVAVV